MNSANAITYGKLLYKHAELSAGLRLLEAADDSAIKPALKLIRDRLAELANRIESLESDAPAKDKHGHCTGCGAASINADYRCPCR
jgi:hypothetical protein